MQFLSDLYPWLTGAAGGLLGAIFLLPSRLGEALFKYRFDRAIESFKAEQAQAIEFLRADQVKQVEKLKEQLNHLGDRGKRSNELEFAAVHSIWEQFVLAYLSTITCAMAFVEYPDFRQMPEPEKEAFISGSDLSDDDRNRLRKATDQNEQYVALKTWGQITRAGREQHDLRLLVRKQRIFMPKPLSDQFMDAVNKLSAVYVQRRMAFQNPRMHDAFGGPIPDFLASHEAMFEQLCSAANARLFRDEVSPR